MSTWVVIWYPRRGDGQLSPQFMCDGAGEDPDAPSVFDTEDDATDAANQAPASCQWPYVVVELP